MYSIIKFNQSSHKSTRTWPVVRFDWPYQIGFNLAIANFSQLLLQIKIDDRFDNDFGVSWLDGLLGSKFCFPTKSFLFLATLNLYSTNLQITVEPTLIEWRAPCNGYFPSMLAWNCSDKNKANKTNERTNEPKWSGTKHILKTALSPRYKVKLIIIHIEWTVPSIRCLCPMRIGSSARWMIMTIQADVLPNYGHQEWITITPPIAPPTSHILSVPETIVVVAARDSLHSVE